MANTTEQALNKAIKALTNALEELQHAGYCYDHPSLTPYREVIAELTAASAEAATPVGEVVDVDKNSRESIVNELLPVGAKVYLAAPQASQPIGQPVSGAGMTTWQEICERAPGVVYDGRKGLIIYEPDLQTIGDLLSASGQAGQSEREAEIDRLAWNEALSAAARYVNGRLAGRAEGSELWLELGKIERGIRALSSTPAQQTEAPVNVPSGWREAIDHIREHIEPGAFAHQQQYVAGIVRPYLDAVIDALADLEAAAPAPVQTEAQQSGRDAYSGRIIGVEWDVDGGRYFVTVEIKGDLPRELRTINAPAAIAKEKANQKGGAK